MTKIEIDNWKNIPSILKLVLEYIKSLREKHNEHPLAPERLVIRAVYTGCARCAAHTLWNWTWRDIFQIVQSR